MASHLRDRCGMSAHPVGIKHHRASELSGLPHPSAPTPSRHHSRKQSSTHWVTFLQPPSRIDFLHHLFVFLPPIKDYESTLPELLVVIQVALEGNICKQAIMDGLNRGLTSSPVLGGFSPRCALRAYKCSTDLKGENVTHRRLVSPRSTSLLTDKPTIRTATAMPPLLQQLTERKPETLDYLSVSYGLMPQLLRYGIAGSGRG
ncbi:hypothetical protein BKA93DRAFT_878658 [Sparassis latifolia]